MYISAIKPSLGVLNDTSITYQKSINDPSITPEDGLIAKMCIELLINIL